jgi:hypothetical protein
MFNVFSQVLLAAMTGQTSFQVKIALTPYNVSITQNGSPVKMSVSKAIQVTKALSSLLVSGQGSQDFKIGNTDYILTLTKAV